MKKNKKQNKEMNKTKEPKNTKWINDNSNNIKRKFIGGKKFPFLFEFVN